MKRFLLAAFAATALLASGGARAGSLLCNNGGLAGTQECTIGSGLSLSAGGVLTSTASASAGGSNGQLQINSSGSFGGIALGGDCTFSSPNITCTKTSGTSFGTAAAASTGSAGHTLPFLDAANDFSGATQTFGAVLGAVVTDSTTARTLGASDCGKTIRFTSSSAITVTAPNSLSVGCHIGIVQDGTAQVTISADSGATVNSAHGYTQTFGQHAGLGLSVMTNSGGSSAVYDLFGDGA